MVDGSIKRDLRCPKTQDIMSETKKHFKVDVPHAIIGKSFGLNGCKRSLAV